MAYNKARAEMEWLKWKNKEENTKGRNSQRRQKGGGAHKQQGAGSFSGRAVVSRCASISVMLFPLIYCSVTCSTQAQ